MALQFELAGSQIDGARDYQPSVMGLVEAARVVQQIHAAHRNLANDPRLAIVLRLTETVLDPVCPRSRGRARTTATAAREADQETEVDDGRMR